MNKFLKMLSSSAENSLAWLLLALSAFSLELVALYFQYIMDLQPCIMCIYQRVAVLGICLAGFIGAFGAKSILSRLIAFITWSVSSIWGLIIALEHVDLQNNSGSLFSTCEFVPNFPSWLPLHQWLPSIFEATGDCGSIDWSLFSLSMPQWMVIIFAIYSVVFSIVLLSRLLIQRRI